MEPTSVSTNIATRYSAYLSYVGDMAEMVFIREIKPYLIAHKLSFRTVNGDYWVEPNNTKSLIERFVATDNLPDSIKHWLEMPVPGQRSADVLGCWMPCFDYKEGE